MSLNLCLSLLASFRELRKNEQREYGSCPDHLATHGFTIGQRKESLYPIVFELR